MTTLAAMKADVQRDLGTSSLTAEIAAAIPRIIKTYQSRPFWFNESRSYTFDTVAGTVWYGAAQDVDIGLIRQLDGVVLERSSGDYPLKPMNYIELEYSTDANASQGEPIGYSYYDQKIGLYPIPDAAYTVRLFGTFALAAPAADDEVNNAWMTEAYDMIRAAAVANLAFFKLRNYDLASNSMKMAKMKEDELDKDSLRRLKRGTVRASTF